MFTVTTNLEISYCTTWKFVSESRKPCFSGFCSIWCLLYPGLKTRLQLRPNTATNTAIGYEQSIYFTYLSTWEIPTILVLNSKINIEISKQIWVLRSTSRCLAKASICLCNPLWLRHTVRLCILDSLQACRPKLYIDNFLQSRDVALMLKFNTQLRDRYFVRNSS